MRDDYSFTLRPFVAFRINSAISFVFNTSKAWPERSDMVVAFICWVFQLKFDFYLSLHCFNFLTGISPTFARAKN